MCDVFKAMCLKMLKTRVTWYMLFFSIAFPLVISSTALVAEGDDIIFGVFDNIVILGMTIVMAFVCIYLCNDFRNKTIYYEIMAGHSRSEVYQGRTLAVSLFALVFFNIQLIITLSLMYFITDCNIFSYGIGFAMLKIILIELLSIAYIVFFTSSALAAKNIIVSVSICWAGIIISQLTSVLNEYKITPDGYPLSAIFGSRVIPTAIVEPFSIATFSLAIGIALAITIISYLIGVYCFKRTQFQ